MVAGKILKSVGSIEKFKEFIEKREWKDQGGYMVFSQDDYYSYSEMIKKFYPIYESLKIKGQSFTNWLKNQYEELLSS